MVHRQDRGVINPHAWSLRRPHGQVPRQWHPGERSSGREFHQKLRNYRGTTVRLLRCSGCGVAEQLDETSLEVGDGLLGQEGSKELGFALAELHDLSEAVFQGRHLVRGDFAQSSAQSFLCHRSDLVTHRHRR